MDRDDVLDRRWDWISVCICYITIDIKEIPQVNWTTTCYN